MNISNTNLYAAYSSTLFEFLILFTFFLSLMFSIFQKRFENRRSLAGISISTSLALSIGLLTWLNRQGYSMQNLGLIAIMIIIAFIGTIIYKLIKNSGHSGIAILTIILLVMPVISRSYLQIDYQMIFDLILFGWLIVIIWLLTKNVASYGTVHLPSNPNTGKIDYDTEETDDQIKRLYRYRGLSKKITENLRKLKKPSELLGDKNKQSTDLLIQLHRILPEQGFMTERMAELRKTAYQVRNGHIARMNETKKLCHQIPAWQARKISRLMIEHYRKQTNLEKRLERLESLVTATEKQNRQLIAYAKKCVRTQNYKEFDQVIHKAKKLQSHVTHIINAIIRTEKKLSAIAHKIAKDNTKPK